MWESLEEAVWNAPSGSQQDSPVPNERIWHLLQKLFLKDNGAPMRQTIAAFYAEKNQTIAKFNEILKKEY